MLLQIITNSPEETERYAARFSQKLDHGHRLALCGELGSGKTTFVRGLYEGLGQIESLDVTSPTFTLIHEYPTQKGPLYHFDLYRMKNFKEFEFIDFDEYFSHNGICVVEWADKMGEIKNEFTWEVRFELVSFTRRKITITRQSHPQPSRES
jgi:tRNA threonylcarbamoyladenosine biosynthesis protein TsaE